MQARFNPQVQLHGYLKLYLRKNLTLVQPENVPTLQLIELTFSGAVWWKMRWTGWILWAHWTDFPLYFRHYRHYFLLWTQWTTLDLIKSQLLSLI
jgi:hypothetical protein